MGACCGKDDGARILLLGLDAAGKTTILHALSGVTQEAVPTIGFNIEKVQTKDFNFSVWDVGGQTELRDLWRHYYPGTNGIVWVVDSHDKKRLGHSGDFNSSSRTGHETTAKELLHELLLESELKGVPVLVLCNKQDMSGCESPESIEQILECKEKMTHREYKCFGVSAKRVAEDNDNKERTNLENAFKWLKEQIKAKYK